jgi:5S rRNA maturation endonuclease (ribonuclease M5)
MTTTKLMTKSPSVDQQKLKILCDDLCDNIEALLDHFNLDYRINDKMITMACPIHGGDNTSAINLYHQGETYRGNWKCRTHHCEKFFKGSIIGFLRGVMSAQYNGWEKPGDDSLSFKDTLDFVQKFLQKNVKDIKISYSSKDKQNFAYVINNLKKDKIHNENLITREKVISSLEIPATYYINRGYSVEILEKYDVGLCSKLNREMTSRIVVPIYDDNHTHMIGCTGRSVFEKCLKCMSFHDPSYSCPQYSHLFPKWKHSQNFKSQNVLYNIWYAKEYIKKSGIVILVEGPGNVWRLEEAGIHNSVALFGCNLSDRQKIILDSSGAMSIVVLTDNDEAGQKAATLIKNKCSNTYRVYCPSISKNDVGEMSIEEVNEQVSAFLEKIQ